MSNVNIRKAELTDAELLYSWANNIEVRANSFNPQPIDFDEHFVWLQRKLSDSNTQLLIGLHDNVAFGQVRFDKDSNGFYEVDIHVSSDAKGRGLGKVLLRSGIEQVKKTSADLQESCFLAVVFEENIASYRLFRSCGFEEIERKKIKDIPCCVLRLCNE
ncbi:hypothetical protein AYJ00_07240 [Shewanella algae]|uniref:GNAT family N-acetyltransferase n=1 Tax=Shewanella algae TaxID=38313 RepID=UPI0011825A5D|nr:GNAT family N-acetyltransferase [Shewanella algae]TVL51523.1 hypothetical protein AYJ00_07240 [Shewanella algae]